MQQLHQVRVKALYVTYDVDFIYVKRHLIC